MARSNLETANYWRTWSDITKVPFKSLVSWERGEKKKFHCTFCQEHGSLKHFSLHVPSLKTETVFACPKCHEYKGLEPCISGYCTSGAL